MKSIGAGQLVLHHHSVREPFTAAKVAKLAPLLKLQPYLTDVIFSQQAPATRWNFNGFRERNWSNRRINIESLCESHFRMFKLPEASIDDPWLWVDYTVKIPGRPVVIHRSPRYHNGSFPWKKIWAQYYNKAVFVGMPDEHQNFCNQVGPIPHHPTADYLELARVIAGARLFIGNQSTPYAMAEAMKQNAILEACPGCADCQFYRANLANDCDGKIVLPII